MATIKAISEAAKGIKYGHLAQLVTGDGKTIKELLEHYAPTIGVDLGVRKERDVLRRRLRNLLVCGAETDAIVKIGGGVFVKMSAVQIKEHRESGAAVAKARADAEKHCKRLGLSIIEMGDSGVTVSHKDLAKLAKGLEQKIDYVPGPKRLAKRFRL